MAISPGTESSSSGWWVKGLVRLIFNLHDTQSTVAIDRPMGWTVIPMTTITTGQRNINKFGNLIEMGRQCWGRGWKAHGNGYFEWIKWPSKIFIYNSCEPTSPARQPTRSPPAHRPRSQPCLLASEILNETEQIPLSPGFGIRNWQIIDKLFGACWLAKTNASRTLLCAPRNRYTFDWWTSCGGPVEQRTLGGMVFFAALYFIPKYLKDCWNYVSNSALKHL